MLDYEQSFAGKRALITGGLGFIGSNLAHRLVDLKAHVLLLDALIPDYGGSIHNVEGIRDLV
ncbi:MAG TPA: NAD-dependent epimerase/dehydratase family protein, partial [Acidobacteriota bacterium]|nr:NAD-dependent epimerase/dehydratase family protein [Acidobacteriota bacterium]